MINVLQLAAGKGSRLKNYTDIPKPFIQVNNEPMFLHAFNSLNLSNVRYHLLCQQSHIEQYDPEKYVTDVHIHTLDHYTDGAATSAYTVINNSEYKNETWLIIDCDSIVTWRGDLPESGSGLFVEYRPWDIKSSYSYIDNGYVKCVAEKQPISKYRNTGQYMFESGNLFCEAYEFYCENNLLSQGEFYISPLYNYIISNGKVVWPIIADKFYHLGTPAELEEYAKLLTSTKQDATV